MDSGLQTVASSEESLRGSNDRAARILDVALQLFSENGYTSVTLRDIARSCGINSALVYYYYHNKEDLFIAALKHAVNRTQAGAKGRRKTDASDDPVAQIQAWFETNERYSKALGQMLRMMLEFRSSQRRSTSVQRLIARFYETEISTVAKAIEKGIQMDRFRAVDVKKTALFVSTHLDGLVVAAIIRSDIDLKRAMRQLQEVLFCYLGVNVDGWASGSSRRGK